MPTRYTQWLLTMIFITLLVIDIVDGEPIKIATTACLSLSVIAFLWGYTRPNQQPWFIAGFAFGALAMTGFVYRLITYLQ